MPCCLCFVLVGTFKKRTASIAEKMQRRMLANRHLYRAPVTAWTVEVTSDGERALADNLVGIHVDVSTAVDRGSEPPALNFSGVDTASDDGGGEGGVALSTASDDGGGVGGVTLSTASDDGGGEGGVALSTASDDGGGVGGVTLSTASDDGG